MRVGKLDIYTNGLVWDDGWWYFFWWNWLDPSVRFWGHETFWYDYPHAMFGFWFFNISWSFPSTEMNDDDWLDKH